jgi:hypothetical protein
VTFHSADSPVPSGSDPDLPPDDVVDQFEHAILTRNRSTINQQDLWAMWNDADPGWAGKSIARTRLATALERLADHGSIELPASGGRLWDHSNPALPLRIRVPTSRRPSSQLLDAAAEPWAPTMRWAAEWIRTAHPPQHLRLAAVEINRWLLAVTGRTPPRVAREERSLHIFNDEKRLARLTDSALFEPGRLALDDLYCDAPLGSLRIARLAAEGPVLVVENKSTFDSAWRTQCEARTRYAAVVFGGGDSVSPLAADLASLQQLVDVCASGFDYAGDLDIAGIQAAAAFADAGRNAGLDVRMARPLWEALAACEPTGEDLTADPSEIPAASQAAQELKLPDAVLAHLAAGQRIPQERLDRTALTDTTWWAPPL